MADKEVFRQLANACRNGLQPDTETGIRPLDRHLPLILNDVRVRMLLQPLAASGGTGSRSESLKRIMPTSGGNSSAQSPSAKKRAKKAAAKQLAAAPSTNRQKATAKPQTAKFVPMPAALRGQNAVTADGSRICFGWNLGSCNNQGTCPKGKHVCCRCFAGHPFLQNGVGCAV